MPDTPLLLVQGLGKQFKDRVGFGRRDRMVEAVHDVSFRIDPGASLAIVGESGSGKTTTARMIVGLERPTVGMIHFEGRELSPQPSATERRDRARKIQIVFQNPYVSLDPRQTASEAVEEVLAFHFDLTRRDRKTQAIELLGSVGLGMREAEARPRRLSGGQNQRVAIARALAAEPRLLVLDEAVSALDVSVQAQILNLLDDLRDKLNVAYLFISHNLAVVRQVSDEVLVMYRGRAVEQGPVDRVLSEPRHPYTQALLASIPRPGVEWTAGTVPLEDPADGCRFRTRCPYAFERCHHEPELLSVDPGHLSRCWLVEGPSSVPSISIGPEGRDGP